DPPPLHPFPTRRSSDLAAARSLSGDQRAKLAECARLDLADALRGDAVLGGELVQGGLVLGHPALLHDVAAARIETAQRAAQPIRDRKSTRLNSSHRTIS